MAFPVNRREFLKAVPAASVIARASITGAAPPRAASGAVTIGSVAYRPVADYPIRSKPFYEVTLTDAFWKPKVALNATVTIPFEVAKLTEGGRALSGNVLEAAMLSLKTRPDRRLQAAVDAAVTSSHARAREGNSGFEAAATRFALTGERDLLDASIRIADALYEDFARNNPPFAGGERDAINCVQVYRATHERRHLDLAKHYLDIRGLESSVNRSRHNQSYKPVLEQSEAVGHAVNCASLMVSLADVGVLTGLTPYLDAARRMWSDAVTRKMYITGGIGSTGNEGFGEPYSLPNISAYAETCAVLMFMTLNHRLFLATGDGKYIDVMERGMYNNALSGVSASGDRFFYVNRLASTRNGRDLRWQRASLECCPPNLVRFLDGMPGLIYAQDPKGAIYVNPYLSSDAAFAISGQEVTLAVTSEMPWGGMTKIAVSTQGQVRGAIKLRIPGWARNTPAPGGLYTYATTIDRQPLIAVNGSAVRATPDAAGYVTIDRVWQSGDVIAADFPMAVRRVMADARVREDRRRTAIERVPIVYCAEGPDCNGGRALDLVFDESRVLETSRDEAFFGGVPVIATEARRMTQPEAPATPVRLIPYHLWANRRRRDDGLALERRLLARRCRARRRADLLRQSQLSRRWMALSRSRAVRSERRREVGMLPPDHSRRHGHGNRHRPKEHG